VIDYDKVLSDKIKKIKPSGIRKFFDIAGTMENVISLGVGEPDFQTPWAVRKAAIQTLEKRRIIYSANKGLEQLRVEISKYLHKKHSVEYDSQSEIIVTVGGSEAIDISIRGVIDPGDEVLIVEPCFVCYAPLVQLAGGIPVSVPTKIENNFKLTVKDLSGKITDKTKLLILPFPNNPTGAIMTRKDLEPIAELLKDTNILILSDEIYSELTYGRKHCSIIELDGMKERTILVNGFSKAFAMTGWRLGYVTAPSPIIDQIIKIHQYAIMCSPTVSQYAAIEALSSCEAEVQKMVDEYNIRRRFLVSELNRIGLECFKPEGAFYVFPSIKSTGLSSEEFCERLLFEENVAVVPGDAFGESGEGYIRISYAYSLKHLMEAVKRIETFVNRVNGEIKNERNEA
jgi:aminotransferase